MNEAGARWTIPRFTLPALVARVTSALPAWPHGAGLALALNAAAKLRMLPREELQRLEGRRFLIVIEDAGVSAHFAFRDGAFRPLAQIAGESDLTIRADLYAFMQLLARQEDPDTLFFNRELTVEGDTELGLIVKNMLDAIEPPKLP
jgi:O2-independent ubiquinone biosynthesis accessory factor UbiT